MFDDLQQSYDTVAEDYAQNFRDELDHKPFDRKLLDWLIEKVGTGGTICDLGCGPGQVAAYLYARGADVCGIDLSHEMVRQAQYLHPHITFKQGNMLSLSNVNDDSFGGIAAFYSIIHLPRLQVVQALRELRRVLKTGGVLLLTFHIGNEVVHRDDWWEKPVCLDFYFFQTEEMKAYLKEAGFALEEVIERDPYPDVEYPSRRAYLFARKAGSAGGPPAASAKR
jgi:ubiquinone/menaquinone biosynthesis C-methylase UbiE